MIKSESKNNGDKKTAFKTAASAAPFALAVLCAAVFLSAAVILFIYATAISVAFGSAMASLMLYGSFAVSLAAGLAAVACFKKSLAFYRLKSGKGSGNQPDAGQSFNDGKGAATYGFSTSDLKKAKLKKLITASNTACVSALIGILLVVVSAGIGGIKRDNWLAAGAGYMRSNGYYFESRVLDLAVPAEDHLSGETVAVTKIEISFKNKNAAIIYSDDLSLGMIRLKGYISYEYQVKVIKSADKTAVSLSEAPSPDKNRALEKMLFFLFDENDVEKQVRVYLPESMRGKVEITGKYVVAKN